jgi:hypothetical protein
MKTTFKIAATSSIVLLLFLFTTDPQSIPSALLVVPFVLLFVVITSGMALMLGAWQLAEAKALKVGATTAAVLILLLGLQSLGQLTTGDILAVIVLFSIACFYASRVGIHFTN